MLITQIPNLFRVGHAQLLTESNTKLWNLVWDSNTPQNILTQDNGRIYFIVVNGQIFKIGYSDSQGGIKNTLTSYSSSGNSGRPSDRTHGIHVLITEELLKGNKVEFYFTYLQSISYPLQLMDGNTKLIDVTPSGKVLEVENLTLYKSQMGHYPIWNLQESGQPWPTYIQESRNNLLSGNPTTLDEIKKRLGFS
jgi:hypothetical protein